MRVEEGRLEDGERLCWGRLEGGWGWEREREREREWELERLNILEEVRVEEDPLLGDREAVASA